MANACPPRPSSALTRPCACSALADAEAALNSRRLALEEAQAKARDAENRYKALMLEADTHQATGKEAAATAKKALADFENLRKEAQLHGDRHAQLWHEAMQCVPPLACLPLVLTGAPLCTMLCCGMRPCSASHALPLVLTGSLCAQGRAVA